ncbi:hypothetical protein QR680_019139 [Steinernema hermaphroditum]|uniref:AAA+ ATPase domain-containing protein n=1 Tax=Steinernema hermaphroditum TaxID=289476 RepID=A0AA39HK31_9BILA|nr:hypothetical protein QR680_019139 [Steinernema hermaphroditum]
MLLSSQRFFGFALPTTRFISSTTVLWKRDRKSGKKLKSKSSDGKVNFPEKFERRMKSWPALLAKEIDACGARSAAKNSEISELSTIQVHGCELQKCSFHAIDGKILEFSAGSAPLPVRMVRRGVPLTLRGNNQRAGVECIFWDHDGDDLFRVKARDLKLDLSDMIGLKFTLEMSNEFGALNSLAEFLAIRHKWQRFPGYHLLQHAYRALPMPMEVADRKLNFVQKLNIEQEKAVCAALNRRRPLVSIQGPPGTGKTYVVTEIILQALRSGQKILVCAPSNQAVDNVLMRVNERVKACRLDSDSNVSLTEYMKSHENYEDLSFVYDQLNSAMADGEDKTIDHLSQKAFDMRSKIKQSIFSSKSVIFCTVSSSSVRGLKKLGFQPDIVLLDEAGQAMECATWLPLLQGSRGILVGDHRQLSAVVTSDEAARGGLGQSLMDSMSSEFGQLTNFMLTIQYRMNDKICKWSNDEFYDSRIRSDPSTADVTLADISRIPSDHIFNNPLIMVDTELAEDGIFTEHRYASSYRNHGEAQIVAKYVKYLLHSGVAPEQIGVISPYSAQVDLLKKEIVHPKVATSSVDAFQGQQKEVIVMSLVRNNDRGNLGFLCDDRRMNVAVTRARRQFVIVSNSRMMAEHKPIKNLRRVIEEHGRIMQPSSPLCDQLHSELLVMSNRSSSVRTAVAPKSEQKTTANVKTATEKCQKNDSNIDPDIARLKIPKAAIKELQALVNAPRQPVIDRGNTAPRDRLFASLLVMTTVAFVAVPLSLCGPSYPTVVGALSACLAWFFCVWYQVHGRGLSRRRIALFNERNFLDTYQIFNREFGHLFQPEPNTPGGCCGPAPPVSESPVLTIGKELIEEQQSGQFQDAVMQHYGGMYSNVKRMQAELALLDRTKHANSSDPNAKLEPADIPLPGASPLPKKEGEKTTKEEEVTKHA